MKKIGLKPKPGHEGFVRNAFLCVDAGQKMPAFAVARAKDGAVTTVPYKLNLSQAPHLDWKCVWVLVYSRLLSLLVVCFASQTEFEV